jgi:hypothetical protein
MSALQDREMERLSDLLARGTNAREIARLLNFELGEQSCAPKFPGGPIASAQSRKSSNRLGLNDIGGDTEKFPRGLVPRGLCPRPSSAAQGLLVTKSHS